MRNLANILEDISQLSLEEMEELQFVTEKYIIEKRRSEIENDHKESLIEFNEGRLRFSSNLDDLKSDLRSDD